MLKRALFFTILLGCSAAKDTATPKIIAGPTEGAAESAEEVSATADPHPSSTMVFSGQVNFNSVKNGNAQVGGSIGALSGSATATPQEGGILALSGVLEIPLGSLDTGLEFRDDRIKETFFGLSGNPTAQFHLLKMKHPAPGSSAMWIDGRLEIGPFSQEVRGHFLATPEEDGSMTLRSGEAMIVSIDNLGMGERAQALLELCGHTSIDDSVEITAEGSIRFDGAQ